jgi:hypothetical protein
MSKVLLVDRDPVYRAGFAEVVRGAGHEVLVGPSLQMALGGRPAGFDFVVVSTATLGDEEGILKALVLERRRNAAVLLLAVTQPTRELIALACEHDFELVPRSLGMSRLFKLLPGLTAVPSA